jgi:hypothetical protein
MDDQENTYRDRLSKHLADNFARDFPDNALEYAVFAQAVVDFVDFTDDEFLQSTFHRYKGEFEKGKIAKSHEDFNKP